MIRPLLLSVCSVLLLAGAFAAEPENPLDGRSFTAHASGVLVTRFGPDAAGQLAGLRLGDIITSYAGKPIATQEELIAAVTANTADVQVVVQRGDAVVTITAKPGKLGAHVSTIAAGTHWELPPATPVTFASERLVKSPIDTWYTFEIDGKKVGAEHARVERVGDRLTVIVEVMFDGGEKWGLNHMIETGVLDVSGAAPRVVTQIHEGPLWDLTSSGKWKDAETWEVTVDGKGDDGKPFREVETSPAPGPLINDYSFASMAALMPMVPGTCHHSRTVVANQAKPNAWSALVVIGPEDLEIAGKTLKATRIERRMLMNKASIHWVVDGEVVKHDYSGSTGSTIAYKTTKEQALAGLDPKLVPRTAK